MAAQKTGGLSAALRRFPDPRPRTNWPAEGWRWEAASPAAVPMLLEVLERHRIPIHCVTWVSAGSIVAAAYASGASPAEIARGLRHALRRCGAMEHPDAS